MRKQTLTIFLSFAAAGTLASEFRHTTSGGEGVQPWNWINAYFDVEEKEGEVIKRAQDALGKWSWQEEGKLDPATNRRDRLREEFIKRHGSRFLEKRALREIDEYTTISKTWGAEDNASKEEAGKEQTKAEGVDEFPMTVTTSLSSSRGRVNLNSSLGGLSATIFRSGNAEARLEPETFWPGFNSYYIYDFRERAGRAIFEHTLSENLGLRTTITNGFSTEVRDDQRFEFIFGRDF